MPIRTLAVALLLLMLTGCAGLPPLRDRPIENAPAVSADTRLGAIALKVASGPEGSGFRLLSEASIALDARLALIRTAQRSIDLQTFDLGDDDVGLVVMRALRDAALRETGP